MYCCWQYSERPVGAVAGQVETEFSVPVVKRLGAESRESRAEGFGQRTRSGDPAGLQLVCQRSATPNIGAMLRA